MSFGTGFQLTVAVFSGVIVASSIATAAGAEAVTPPAMIRHHELFVSIQPDLHQLSVEDRMALTVAVPKVPVRFTLARSITLTDLQLEMTNGGERRSSVPFVIQESAAASNLQIVTVNLPPGSTGELRLVWRYDGLINDPPREPRHLRFVTPSETSGHIGTEGIYLSSESEDRKSVV